MESTVNYIEIKCKSACNELKQQRPYHWDLNIYRGCTHRCRYCFAIYSHDYMLPEGIAAKDYYNTIFVKTNVAEQLERQLASPKWKKDVINIGGVTDSYQHAEKEYKLMPDILRIMIKYKNPIIISTKSDLILRDFDLIDRLSSLTYVNIASTITTTDEIIRQKIEPGAVSSQRRFSMLKEFNKSNASIGVHVMPLLPYLTDSEENIRSLYDGAVNCGADYLLPQFLNLRGKTRQEFFEFLFIDFPGLISPYGKIFNNHSEYEKYKSKVYTVVRKTAKAFRMPSDYMAPMRLWMKNGENNCEKPETEQLHFL